MTGDDLREIPLLAGLSEQGLARVAGAAAEVRAAPGQTLALQGDTGSGMFVLLEGSVTVELPTGELEIAAPDFVGELALILPDTGRLGRVARGPTSVASRCHGPISTRSWTPSRRSHGRSSSASPSAWQTPARRVSRPSARSRVSRPWRARGRRSRTSRSPRDRHRPWARSCAVPLVRVADTLEHPPHRWLRSRLSPGRGRPASRRWLVNSATTSRPMPRPRDSGKRVMPISQPPGGIPPSAPGPGRLPRGCRGIRPRGRGSQRPRASASARCASRAAGGPRRPTRPCSSGRHPPQRREHRHRRASAA